MKKGFAILFYISSCVPVLGGIMLSKFTGNEKNQC